MSRRVEDYLAMTALNDGTARALTRGVGEDEARRRFGGRSSFRWILGHVAEHRAVPLEILGGDRASKFDLSTAFARDTAPTDDATPTLAELLEEFLRFGALLGARVRELGDAAFERTHRTPAGVELPTPAFFYFHETYHLGQLGLLRTWLGKPPLVPPQR
ncbi:MAG TPA: DinB family protein [Planctomycetota bacterium]|nr:DinB family protein [Planctomycetota bacterium]